MAKKKYGVVDIESEDEFNEPIAAQESVEIRVQKPVQVLEIPNSDYINSGLDISELSKYNLKSITLYKGRNTIIEIYKEV